MAFDRRAFLRRSSAGVVSACCLSASGARQLIAAGPATSLQRADVRDWGIEGKAFTDTEAWFDRLPRRAKGVVRDSVWGLSRQSAGMMARFSTDATEIHVDHALTSSTLAMPHMPATGVSGLDLYAQDNDGAWKWVAVLAPTSQHTQSRWVAGLAPGYRNYAVYLPLYNGTASLRLGVPIDAKFQPVPPRQDKPMVFYGTSITQGACASRPGMAHPAILGRRLDRSVINMGFSGSGTMDLEVGRFLAELDASVILIDCLPNMTAEQVTERTVPLVNLLRASRPNVPIVLVEDRSYSNAWLIPSQRERNETSRSALRREWDRLLQSGVERLSYVDGDALLGIDREGTTDGSHPSDLGFVQHADALEPILRDALAHA